VVDSKGLQAYFTDKNHAQLPHPARFYGDCVDVVTFFVDISTKTEVEARFSHRNRRKGEQESPRAAIVFEVSAQRYRRPLFSRREANRKKKPSATAPRTTARAILPRKATSVAPDRAVSDTAMSMAVRTNLRSGA
jgi:hypothetical protein